MIYRSPSTMTDAEIEPRTVGRLDRSDTKFWRLSYGQQPVTAAQHVGMAADKFVRDMAFNWGGH